MNEPKTRLLDDKAMMDWLDQNVEHLNPCQGAPAATNISVMLNGGHFTAREAITLCMTEAHDLSSNNPDQRPGEQPKP